MKIPNFDNWMCHINEKNFNAEIKDVYKKERKPKNKQNVLSRDNFVNEYYTK